MRRILLAVAILGCTLMFAASAQAGWGHHHHGGYGGFGYGGYRGFGYGGYRYGGLGYGYGGYGLGYRGFGYGPYYGGYGLSIGYYRPSCLYGGYGGGYSGCGYCGSSYYGGGYYGGYGGYGGYYAPLPIGYYGYYGSTYNPGSNFLSLSVSSASVSPTVAARPAIAPATVRNLLSMSREELLAALREPKGAAGDPRITTITPATGPSTPKAASRISNAEQRRKAEQYLAAGDLLFRDQQFHSALQRYKLAAQTAPDLAEAYWRQGHAMIATANFELAGGAFKRAIALDPDTIRGGFRLDEIYGAAAMAKAAHLESLAGWALAHSESSEPYFLMGVQLQYDGQTDRAGRFFARAADLAGVAGGHVAVFAPAGLAADKHSVAAHPAAPPVAPEPGIIPPAPDEPTATLEATPPLKTTAPPQDAPVVEKKPAPAVSVTAAVEI